MRHLPRALGVLGATLLLVSCVSSDSSTGPGDAADPAGVVIQPAVVPTAADASALPINRIRAVTSLWPSNLVLADTTIVVDPAAAEWDLALDVRLRESPAIGHVFLYLINQADSARIQYSGKTDTMTLVRNQVSESGDVLLVRGPLSNLFVTGVAITGPGTVVERRTLALAAEVETTSTSSQLPVVFWTSLDTTVVTVDGSEAFGVRTGSALVVATAGAYSDTASVTVTTAPVGSVEVTPAAAQVVIGTTAALAATVRADDGVVLTDRPVRWSSSAPAIASVDSLTGVVTAVELGSATISATSESVTGTATVTVVPVPVDSVLVSPDSADVDAGATIAFGAQTFDADGNELDGRVVTWTTSNPSIATVDPSTGVVRGVAAGVTTVTATSEGMSDQATVVVLPPPGGPGGVNTWIATGGTWSTSANWSLGRVPIPQDTVRLTQDADYSVTLDVDATVARLTIGGTSDFISLSVDDRTLTVTDAGPAALELLPLGSIQLGSGLVRVESIVNGGSIRVVGTAALEATAVVNNSSLVVAGTGVLTVDHPTSVDFRTSGTMTIEDGASLVLAGGATKNLTFIDGVIDGPGILLLGSLSSLILESELAIEGPQVILQEAAIIGSGANLLTIGPSSSLTLVSETGQASVNTVVVNEGILQANGPNAFLNDSLYTGGQVLVQAGATPSRLGTVDVVNGGTILLTGDGATFGPGGAAGRRILNQGSGDIVTLSGGSSVIDGELVNEGTVTIAGPTELSRRDVFGNHVAAAHENSGDIVLEGGDLTVVLGGSAPSFTNTGILSVGPPGTLTFDNLSDAAVTNAVDGQIIGDGTVEFTGPTGGGNDGTIAPGFSPGTLTWIGDLAMTATSTLAMELDGTTAGSFDLLVVSGTAAVDGALVVDTVPGFTPSPGDRFPILVFGQRGPGAVFESVTFPTVAGIAFDTVWAEAGSVDTLFIEASAGSASPVNRWIDPAGGNWSDTGNWSLGVVPVPGDSAVIDEPGTYNVLLDVGATVDHLTVGGPGAQVSFQHSANTLTVAQSLSVAAGSSYALGGTGVLAGAHVGTFDGDMLWSSGTWAGAAATTLRSGGRRQRRVDRGDSRAAERRRPQRSRVRHLRHPG